MGRGCTGKFPVGPFTYNYVGNVTSPLDLLNKFRANGKRVTNTLKTFLKTRSRALKTPFTLSEQVDAHLAQRNTFSTSRCCMTLTPACFMIVIASPRVGPPFSSSPLLSQRMNRQCNSNQLSRGIRSCLIWLQR